MFASSMPVGQPLDGNPLSVFDTLAGDEGTESTHYSGTASDASSVGEVQTVAADCGASAVTALRVRGRSGEGNSGSRSSGDAATMLRLPTSYFIPEVPAFVRHLDSRPGAVARSKWSMWFADTHVESEFLTWFYAGSRGYWYLAINLAILVVLAFFIWQTRSFVQYGAALAFVAISSGVIAYLFYFGCRWPCGKRAPRNIAIGHELLSCAVLGIGVFWVALFSADTMNRCAVLDGALLDFARSDPADEASKFFCSHHVPAHVVGAAMLPMMMLQPRFIICVMYSIAFVAALLLSPTVPIQRPFELELQSFYLVVAIVLPIVIASTIVRYLDERSLRVQFAAIGRVNQSIAHVHRAKEARKAYVEELFPPPVRRKLFSSRVYVHDKSRDATCIMLDIADFPIWCTQRLPRDAAIIAAAVADIINQEALAVDITPVYSSGDVFCGCCNLLEPRPHHAVRAAFVAIKTYSQLFTLHAQFHAAVFLRCAINTGLLYGDVIGETHLRFSVYGPCYRDTASLLSAAHPQDIIASRATRDLFGGHVEERFRQLLELPDGSKKIDCYDVINMANGVDIDALFRAAATEDSGALSGTDAHSARSEMPPAPPTQGYSSSTATDPAQPTEPSPLSPIDAFSLDGSATPPQAGPPDVAASGPAEAAARQHGRQLDDPREAGEHGASDALSSLTEPVSSSRADAAQVLASLLTDPSSTGFDAIARVVSKYRTAGDPCCAHYSGGARAERAFVCFSMSKDAALLQVFFCFNILFVVYLFIFVEVECALDSTRHGVGSPSSSLVQPRRMLFALAIIANIPVVFATVYNKSVAGTARGASGSPGAPVGGEGPEQPQQTAAGATETPAGGDGGDGRQRLNSSVMAVHDGRPRSPAVAADAFSAVIQHSQPTRGGGGAESAMHAAHPSLPANGAPPAFEMLFMHVEPIHRRTLRVVMVIGALVQSLLLLAALGCSRPTVPASTSLWYVPLLLVGMMPLYTCLVSFSATAVVLYGASIGFQKLVNLPLLTEHYWSVDALICFISLWMFAKRSRRSRDHFRFVKVHEAIARMMRFEEAMREKMLQAVIPRAAQPAAQQGRLKNTLEVTNLDDVVVCALRFDDFSGLHATKTVRRSLKHQIAIFETALRMLCPETVAVVKSLGDTLCIAGPLFTRAQEEEGEGKGKEEVRDVARAPPGAAAAPTHSHPFDTGAAPPPLRGEKRVTAETFNAAASLLKTLAFLRQKDVAFSAAITYEMGFGVLSNAQYPSYDLLGVAAYSARALLFAAATSSVIVTQKLVSFISNVDPHFGQPPAFVSPASGSASFSSELGGQNTTVDGDGVANGSGSGTLVQRENSDSISRDLAVVVTRPGGFGGGNSHGGASGVSGSRSYTRSINDVVTELRGVLGAANDGAAGGQRRQQPTVYFKGLETWRVRGLGAISVHQLAFRIATAATAGSTAPAGLMPAANASSTAGSMSAGQPPPPSQHGQRIGTGIVATPLPPAFSTAARGRSPAT